MTALCRLATTGARLSSGSTKPPCSSITSSTALLNGIASARAAANPTPRILGQLDALMRSMRASKDSRSFAEICGEYRRTVNDEYAGPRLHAIIRASHNLIPRMFWTTYQNTRDDILPFYEKETSAIHRRDPDAARAACMGRSQLMAQTMLAELFRRRVFAPPDDCPDHRQWAAT